MQRVAIFKGNPNIAGMRITSASQFVGEVLKDRLWHTTSYDRFCMILRDGALKVEPPLPESARHKTANGPINYSFVRSLGGVSLFNFADFHMDGYESLFPLSNWRAFVPLWHAWERSIWIEIDACSCDSIIIQPNQLLDRWRFEQAWGHTIMPQIEAAHIGDVPMQAFRSSMLVTPIKAGEWEVDFHDFKVCQSAPAPR